MTRHYHRAIAVLIIILGMAGSSGATAAGVGQACGGIFNSMRRPSSITPVFAGNIEDRNAVGAVRSPIGSSISGCLPPIVTYNPNQPIKMRRIPSTISLEDFMQTHLITRAMAALIIVLGLALGSSAASAAAKGQSCGGLLPVTCGPAQFCQLPAGKCKGADLKGVCVKIPAVCPKNIRPVCGCDGKTYNNDCERQMASVQLDHTGRCKTY